jgi:Family of unknown function (DUF5906)
MSSKNYQALLAEKRAELGARKLYQIYPNDEYIATAAKLLANYAYCEFGKLNAVPLYSRFIGNCVEVQKLKQKHLQNSEVEVGPRGGQNPVNPVDLWLKSQKRINVAGQQMRPDQLTPLFTDEEGETWANVYRPVAYDPTGGDPRVGIEYLEYLLPNPAERIWFTQWISFKLQNPEVPGCSVIMVARTQGSGRATLSDFCARLLGKSYVLNLGFDILAGKNNQAQFNEWNAGRLLVCVAESSKSEGGSSYQTKQNCYEVLKEVCEPRSIERYFSVKLGRPFTGRHHTSFIISTNHTDALPLAEGDRRFAVLTNGEASTDTAFWETFNSWMAIDANIGAFSEWLFEVDLSDYSPYRAPGMTAGKRDMIHAAKSDLDHGIAEALESIKNEVFSAEQIISRMRAGQHENGFDFPPNWTSVAKRELHNLLFRVGVRDGVNWKVRIDGVKVAAYARDRKTADKWQVRDDLRAEMLRGHVRPHDAKLLPFRGRKASVPAAAAE